MRTAYRVKNYLFSSLTLKTTFFLLTLLCTLPVFSEENLQEIVDNAYELYKDDNRGENATYIPELADVPSDLFGIVIVTKDGEVFSSGDSNYVFSIQSISKAFNLSPLITQVGKSTVASKIGVNATGLPFDSILAIRLNEGSPGNPLVNAGAMATVGLMEPRAPKLKWKVIKNNLQKFAGRPLPLLEDVYESESQTNSKNLKIAQTLDSYGTLYGEVETTLDTYTKMCSLGVSTVDLGIMGATLANRGINPITQKQVLPRENTDEILSIMATSGLYENTGSWMYSVGLPAKSGVSGGIVSIYPNEYGIAAFSPRLDKSGNSVRAQLAIEYIANELELNVFAPPSRKL